MRFCTMMMIAASAALAAAPAAAENVVADVDQIARVMKAGGYTVEVKTDKHERYIRASRGKDAYGFSVLLYGCDDGTMLNCKSVQFYSGFTTKKKIGLEAMNEYSRANRWGRVYHDKVGDPVVEMDVDLEKGGMSEALFLDNLEYFETVMNRFADFVFDS